MGRWSVLCSRRLRRRRRRAHVPGRGGRPSTRKCGARASPALLWEEYRAAHPDEFGYSWFCEHYDAFKSRLRPTMRQSHAAGEKVFVDFAGDTIDVVDPTTGEVRPMKLFVVAMGAAHYIFAQARPSAPFG